MLADEIVYDDLAPWPTQADFGDSLNRLAAGVRGTDALNWSNATPTPGNAVVAATVVTRSLFYNNSSFDENSVVANVDDDLAIAPSIKPLFNGVTASFENYSSYANGINGIMIDVTGLRSVPTASDFQFMVGNSDDVSTWTAAPAPTSISVRPGDGNGDADRVSIVWADEAVTNTWLQVRMSVDGLPAGDVFYFGSVIGESGNDPNNAIVNLIDVGTARTNQTGFSLTTIDNPVDFNRDQRVNLADVAIARSNQSGFFPVPLITPDGSSESSRGVIGDSSEEPTSNSTPVVISENEASSFRMDRELPTQTRTQAVLQIQTHAPVLEAEARSLLPTVRQLEFADLSKPSVFDKTARIATEGEGQKSLVLNEIDDLLTSEAFVGFELSVVDSESKAKRDSVQSKLRSPLDHVFATLFADKKL